MFDRSYYDHTHRRARLWRVMAGTDLWVWPADAGPPRGYYADPYLSERFAGTQISVVYAPYRPCQACAHYRGFQPGADVLTCDAYPEKIPIPIWALEHDHREPYPGDGGVRFEDYEPDAPYDWGVHFYAPFNDRPFHVFQGHDIAVRDGTALDPGGFGARIEARRAEEGGAR